MSARESARKSGSTPRLSQDGANADGANADGARADGTVVAPVVAVPRRRIRKTWSQRWFPTFRAVYLWWRASLTDVGGLLACFAALCVPGAVLEQPLAIQLLSSLAVLFLLANGMGWLFRPRLESRVHGDTTVQAGRVLELGIHLTNRRRLACFDLELEVDSGEPWWELLSTELSSLSCEPGQTVEGRIRLRALRRGEFPGPTVIVSSTFPLNLLRRRQRVAAPERVIVTPTFVPLQGVDIAARGGGEEKAAASGGGRGASWDYLGSREHQTGMAVRRWDYGAWARLGKPIVREFEDFSQSQADVLVDTAVLPAASSTPGASRETGAAAAIAAESALEAVLSLAAALVVALQDGSWRIQSMVTERGPDLAEEPPTPPSRVALMRQLGRAAPQTADTLGEMLAPSAAPRAAGARKSRAAFVVLSGWDPGRRELVRRLKTQYADVRALAPHAAGAPSGEVTGVSVSVSVSGVPQPHFRGAAGRTGDPQPPREASIS